MMRPRAIATCRGFGLVELMVGILIALLVVLAVYGTLIVGEAGRRSAMGSNGAFGNGMAGLFMMQTDAKNAGGGLVQNGAALCNGINVYHAGSVVADGAAIAPVVIADAGSSAASDQITIAQATSSSAGIGTTVVLQMTSAAAVYKVSSIRGMSGGGMYLAANPSQNATCTLGQVTALAPQAYGGDVAHAAGEWNAPDPAATFASGPAYPAGSELLYLGDFQWTAYRVRQERLERVDLLRGTVDVLADNVVLMKAWYGTTDGSSAAIEQWTPAANEWSAPLDAAHVAAVRAIRVVLVTRAPVPEKPSVSGGACDATTQPPASWPGGPVLDLSANPRWQCYRYRTLTLAVPLKNVAFGA